ncbi:MAG: hypothetical protein ACOX52_20730 [Verrucomicrobiota bacterium]
MEPTQSHWQVEKRHRALCGRFSGSVDGGDSRRGRRGIGRGGCSYIGAVISNCLGLLKRNI